MILGILSLVVCGILGPVAIILYVTASREMAHGGYSKASRTVARAGLIMGIISIALNAFGLLMMWGMWGEIRF